ncbi:hypothetical protein DDE18_17205 [Nocardioides gansuensis]|uniref:Uncharacterized protein n=1 Tax=Nocardioides gansuensis TaxID=2138300 RepID=A0A2T8F7S3_9ACTN|nr:hypothetical protein [Nocardioides gansuensis]PVG81717.1 hypothetical protein DDE18_17205 [Nocardioides gansuensis]
MSYDIAFVSRAPGQGWDDALESTGSGQDASPEERARLARVLDRIEAGVQGTLGPWERYDEEDGSLVGELTDPTTGVQIGVYSSMASLSYPYWEQDDPAAFHAAVRRLVAVVAEETGMEPYDPQTGEAFDGTFEDESGLEAVRQLGADMGVPDHAAAAPVPDPTRQPPPVTTRRRRDDIVLLVIGIVVTLVALVMLAAGNRGFWTWTALVVGVVDILLGGRRLASRP